MNSILVDSDVILDFLFDRKPFAEDAAKILACVKIKRSQVCYSCDNKQLLLPVKKSSAP